MALNRITLYSVSNTDNNNTSISLFRAKKTNPQIWLSAHNHKALSGETLPRKGFTIIIF